MTVYSSQFFTLDLMLSVMSAFLLTILCNCIVGFYSFLVISFVLFDCVGIVCLFVRLSVCLFCLLANKRVHNELLL